MEPLHSLNFLHRQGHNIEAAVVVNYAQQSIGSAQRLLLHFNVKWVNKLTIGHDRGRKCFGSYRNTAQLAAFQLFCRLTGVPKYLELQK